MFLLGLGLIVKDSLEFTSLMPHVTNQLPPAVFCEQVSSVCRMEVCLCGQLNVALGVLLLCLRHHLYPM